MRTISSIKQSIKAISDTTQITSAMHLISASKMQKAIQRYTANSLYFNKVRSCMKDILMHTTDNEHIFFKRRTEGKPVFVVIAADKGLCGGYNHDVLSFATEKIKQYGDYYIITIGQEARAYFEAAGIEVDIEYQHLVQEPNLFGSRNLAFELIDLYLNQDITEVSIIYTKFISSMNHQPCCMELLPIDINDFKDVKTDNTAMSVLNYHPSANKVFDTLVLQYIIGIVYGALVQSFTSENCQRMIAMENATSDAKEMIEKLKIQLNRSRQQQITRDITEIVSAMDALKD